jgi:DNA-binding NarL/FixJ family response regulator
VTWDVPAPRAAFIDVRDEVGAAALCFLVERSGRFLDHHGDGGSWMVSDRLDRRRVIDVLVCGATLLDAQAAVLEFGAGRARSVVCLDQPGQVVDALDALDRDLCLLPSRVIERANAAPRLHARQALVLRAVMAGQSNAEIARSLQLRPVTIKREVAGLFAIFGVCRRFELISRAFDVGYRGLPARP